MKRGTPPPKRLRRIAARTCETLLFALVIWFGNDAGAQAGKSGNESKYHIPPNAKPVDGTAKKPESMNLAGPSDGPASPDLFPKKIDVEVLTKRVNFSLNVRLVEVHPSAIDKLMMSKNVKDPKRYVPILADVKDGKLVFSGPSSKVLAFVIENPSDKPVYFFAPPHSIEPVRESLGVKWKCLCFGEVYRIRPRHSWVRVMELKVLPQNRSSRFVLAHELIGIPESEIPPGESD